MDVATFVSSFDFTAGMDAYLRDGHVILAYAVIRISGAAARLGVVCLAAALLAQGRGHKLERETPAPFDGTATFVSRFVAEQGVIVA